MSVQPPEGDPPQGRARRVRVGTATPPARARAVPRAAPAATAAAKAPSAPRRPQQERGQRRVEAILDAAAAIIGEEGIPAATMHAVARRSGTTIGSMYHFFPDRDAVLVALLERHARAVGDLAARLAALDWSRLSLEEVVERFVDPLLGYAVEHPDLLPVIHTVEAFNLQKVRRAAPESLMFQLAESIVAGRTPEAPRAERTARAATVLAVVEGVAGRMARVPTPSPAAMRRELRRLLVAYLGAFER